MHFLGLMQAVSGVPAAQKAALERRISEPQRIEVK
jgi:hypothetical protein